MNFILYCSKISNSCLSWRPPALANAPHSGSRKKSSQITMNHYTLFALCMSFIVSSVFCHCSRIVCRGLSRQYSWDDFIEKSPKVSIWAMWPPLANSLPKKFCQKRHCIFRHMFLRIILLKNCILLNLTQKCNKLLNNIVVHLCGNCCRKKISPTARSRLMVHQTPIF